MKKSWLGVAGSAALVFGLFACSGEDGADGINGKDGQNGLNGVSCEVAALKSGNGYKVLCDGDSVGVLKNGAKGDPGEKGSTGDDGTSCTVDTLAKQVGFKVLCDGDSVGVLLNGVPGESCTTSEADDGIAITCGSTTTIVKNGADGTSCTAEENATKTGFVLSCGGKVVGTILNGSNGVNGTSCTAEENATKTGFVLSCDGKKVGTILNGSNGANGKSCSAVVNNDGNFDLSCDGVAVGTIKNGANGTSCEAEKVTTADGRSGLEVTCGGTVVDTVWNGDKGETGAGCTISDDPDQDGVVNITCGETTTQIFKAMCGVEPYDPAKKFCVNSKSYDLCNGSAFDPATMRCNDKVEPPTVVGVCEGKDYDLNTQKCEEGKILTYCGTENNNWYIDTTEYFCSENMKVPVKKCGVDKLVYDFGNEMCVQGVVKPYCGLFSFDAEELGELRGFIMGFGNGCGMTVEEVGVCDPYEGTAAEGTLSYYFQNTTGKIGVMNNAKTFDPATQFCQAESDTVLTLCNSKTFTKDEFCDEGVIREKCGGQEYRNGDAFCSNGKVYGRCDADSEKDGSYDPERISCLSGYQSAFCEYSVKDSANDLATLQSKYDDAVWYDSTVVFDGDMVDGQTCLIKKDGKWKILCPVSYDDSEKFCDMRDHQAYTYKAIKLNASKSQVWMTENLNYDVSGSILPGGDWSSFGRLYTWTAAMALDDKYLTEFASGTDAIKDEHQGVCPEGWHMPSEIEFLALRDAWTNVEELAENGNYLVSFKFKADTSAWDNANAKEATNVTGFSAMPVGFYVTTGTPGYSETGLSFRMWLAGDKTTQQTYIDSGKDNPSAAYRFQTHLVNDVLGYNNDNSKSDYYAVRCVKNAD